LETRFLVFSLVVFVAGALVIGGWVSRSIRDGVLASSGATSALYADSFLGPELQGESVDGPLTPELIQRLDSLFASTRFGERIVSFKLWGAGGVIRYARDERLIGRVFEADDALAEAFDGAVVSNISNLTEEENEFEASRWSRLVETYAPVRSAETGEVIAAAEFYELPDDLESELQSSQQTGWLIVGAATLAMFVLLNGLVRRASATIRRQHTALAALTGQLQKVSLQKVETDEAVMRRVSQDLHDGPAQNLAFANLRIGVVQASTRDTSVATDVEKIGTAVEEALKEIREISAEMRLPELGGLSLRDIVARAAAEHENRSGETVEVRGNDAAEVLGVAAATTIFRVVTEALSNAARHAAPGERRVLYDCGEVDCRVQVEDDGPGFHPLHIPEGLGLRGMRERAALLGGRLMVRSEPGRKTIVELVLPRAVL
jgi:signal transduction histidine kinase